MTVEIDVSQHVKFGIPEDVYWLFDPKKTAAVTIDMHRGHLDTDATIPCPWGVRIIPTLANFLTRVRELDIPVIHVIQTFRKGVPEIKNMWPWYSANFQKRAPRYREHNIEGSKYTELVEGMAKEGDLYVTSKRRYSVFHSTDLELLLRNLGVDTVILTGIATDGCVLNSAYDAVNRDFKVLVPMECTAGFGELEKAALQMIQIRIGWVAPADEILALMKKQLQIQALHT